MSSTRKPPSKRGKRRRRRVSPRALSDGVSSHGIWNERLSAYGRAAAGGFKAGPKTSDWSSGFDRNGKTSLALLFRLQPLLQGGSYSDGWRGLGLCLGST